MRYFLFVSFLCLAMFQGESQMLIDVGYSPSYYSLDIMASVKNKFNSDRPWLQKEIKSFHMLHGVHVRIKHRFEHWGPWLETSYQLNSNSYEGIQPPNTSVTKGNLRTSLIMYGAGLEWETKGFGIGAGFGRQSLGYRLKEETPSQRVNDKLPSIKSNYVTVFMNILPAIDRNNIANLVLQPFAIYPLNTSDFSSISEYFSLSTDAIDEKFWQIGLRIILSNGQR